MKKTNKQNPLLDNKQLVNTLHVEKGAPRCISNVPNPSPNYLTYYLISASDEV